LEAVVIDRLCVNGAVDPTEPEKLSVGGVTTRVEPDAL